MESQAIQVRPKQASTTLRIALRENNKIAINESIEGLDTKTILERQRIDKQVKDQIQSVEQTLASGEAYLEENPEHRETMVPLMDKARKDMEVLKQHEPMESLALAKKIHGEKHLESLQLLILETVKFFNVGKTMNADQVVMLSFDIQREFYSLTLEDIAVCLRNGRSGHYGKVYDRIDGAVFMDWLQMYNGERSELFAAQRDADHNQSKSWGDSSRDTGATVDTEYQKFKLQYDSNNRSKTE